MKSFNCSQNRIQSWIMNITLFQKMLKDSEIWELGSRSSRSRSLQVRRWRLLRRLAIILDKLKILKHYAKDWMALLLTQIGRGTSKFRYSYRHRITISLWKLFQMRHRTSSSLINKIRYHTHRKQLLPASTTIKASKTWTTTSHLLESQHLRAVWTCSWNSNRKRSCPHLSAKAHKINQYSKT